MEINETNIDQYLGKTVDADRRLYHHYPLTILKMPFGYCYKDSVGVFCLNDFKKCPIYFDRIIGGEESNIANAATKRTGCAL